MYVTRNIVKSISNYMVRKNKHVDNKIIKVLSYICSNLLNDEVAYDIFIFPLS